MKIPNQFSLQNKTVVITGGAGLLGRRHAEAVMASGGAVVLLDIHQENLARAKKFLQASSESSVDIFPCDITHKESLLAVKDEIISKIGCINGLINNAANNPKVGKDQNMTFTRFENFSLEQWSQDINVGLTGAFLCSQVFGTHMAESGGGVILNIASDLSVISPDQRIYREQGLSENEQPAKPVTYSVVKTALVGLTRYLATYWASKNIRVNSLSPGGVLQDQSEEFVAKLTQLIPMERMAHSHEYQGAIQFLCSDASSYMTGQNIVMDGGRSVW